MLPLRKGMRLKFPQLYRSEWESKVVTPTRLLFFFFPRKKRKKKNVKKIQSEQARLKSRGGSLPPLIVDSQICGNALCGEADLIVWQGLGSTFFDAEED